MHIHQMTSNKVCWLEVVLNEVVSHSLHDSTALGWLYACGVCPHQESTPRLHHTNPTVSTLSPQHQPTRLTPQEYVVFSPYLIYSRGRGAYEVQWNLRTMDKLGTSILSIVQRLSLLRRYIEMYGQYNRQGVNSVSIVGRLCTLQSVLL